MTSKIIDRRQGMRFGMGVDSIVEEVRGEALRYEGQQHLEGGQDVKAEVRMVETQKSLMESLNISASLSARYGLAASGDLKFSFADNHAVNEYSISMLFKAFVRNPPRSIVNPRLTAEADERYRDDPDKFRDTFGDCYVDEIYSGGEFFGLFIFNSRDESSRTDLKVDLDLSIGNFMAGADLKASFSNTISKHSRSSSMHIVAIMSGGQGLENPSSLDELDALYSSFNAEVSEAPIDYRVGLKNFKYLPLPETPIWVSQLVRRDTIEQCGRMVVDGIALRSRLDYLIGRPGQFEPFDLDAAKNARARAVDMIKNAAERAEACASDIDQCHLHGVEPVAFEPPKRLATANPLASKWDELLKDDRAKPWFSENLLSGTSIDDVQHFSGGIYKLFRNEFGVPVSGIFWNPRVNSKAFGVYGGIFEEYNKRGHCEGELRFPRSDEQTLQYGSGLHGNEADGLDRISYFQGGVLWWDAQTGVVSDKEPRNPLLDIVRGPALGGVFQ